MKTKFLLPATLFASLLSVPVTLTALEPATLEPLPHAGDIYAPDDQNSPYAEGTRAINEGRWSDAGSIFSKIASQRGDRADAALYWKAYAENKEGQSARALETCADLGRSYSKSRWITECDALRIEIRGASGNPVQPQSTPDDDLKMLALNALMQQDEGRAMPILQQILQKPGPDKLKEKALFVLANSNTPEAQNAIAQIARGQSNPQLQVRAIRMYAAIKGKQSTSMLSDVYQHSSDEAVKRAILQSYLVSGSPDKLMEAARGEQNPNLVKAAIQSLGAMGAISDLSTLYRDKKDTQARTAILNALVAAGPKGSEMLNTIATTEQDPELRRRAIRNLGVTGGKAAAPSLVAAYQSSSDVESKRAALDGLFISGDATDLVSLARSEKNPELKQAIVSKLSIMHSKEATDYMMEILNK
ncbi:HEAT repeat domain-containing protein [Edaphobacter albus]|uniref:HEAT repeat domain-containing protein n=1 Tax=Edaphobacter sp. 4G125 TaxID=2763071 RepID=UPI0016458405|nr:HEAT repeat domain-containing protein [Edaphobacter sp. 4G125]QNI36698.1 HEAT repeat domain-containing protein [Edaphobacter sp. 4G125]